MLFLYISLALQVLKWKWMDTPKLIQFLNQELSAHGVVLDASLEKRIKLYVVISSFTIKWLCTLRGYKPTKDEVVRSHRLAALIPLLDDLSDTHHMSSSEIRKYVLTDNVTDGKIDLVKKLYNSLVSECGESFVQCIDAAALAQDASMKQMQPEVISENELREITYNKGSLSLLLYRKILSHAELEGESEAISQLGYLLQYLNDMFDIFKDRNEKQQTLFTMYPDMQARRTEFENILHTFKTAILQLPFSKKNKLRCLAQLLTVTSRGEVMMNQLLTCEKSTSGKFELHSYSRQQLVCDMEKWENIKASYLYSVKAFEKLTS
jgi:hypothetical protein